MGTHRSSCRSASRAYTHHKSQAVACLVSVKGFRARYLAEEQRCWAALLGTCDALLAERLDKYWHLSKYRFFDSLILLTVTESAFGHTLLNPAPPS